MLLPISLFAYFLFKKVSATSSKLFNLIAVTTIISIQHLLQTEDSLVIIFFIPILISTLLIFQGKSKRLGLTLTGLIFILMLILLNSDFRLGFITGLPPDELKKEQIINIVGSTLISLILIIYKVDLSNFMQQQTINQNQEIKTNNTKLLNINNTKNIMISIISHDIRNPLITISSALKLFKENGFINKTVNTELNFNLINELILKSENAVCLLDNMIVWARSQSETLAFNPTKMSLDKLIKLFSKWSLSQMSTKQIDFIVECRETGFIFVDEIMIETIIRNLMSNAIKFTPEKGIIKLSIVTINQMLNITLYNTGKGIDQPMLENIINGVSFSTQGLHNESGHGLGLMIISEFLQKHNSKLSVTSSRDVGTSFSFELLKI
jgi:signal transduction histidine kinase